MQTRELPLFARKPAVRRLVAGLLFSVPAVLLFPQVTTSEDAGDDESDVVVLDTYTVRSGFAGSLAAAAETKKNLQLIAEVVVAEDIGKLPDISIADSLTRLTGITTQRTNGRSQGLNIRGLQGDFSTGLLNGREQVSTSLNRSVEFDQYPAELLGSVYVYKTPEARIVGQGIAATVDMRTVRPLDSGERTVVVNGYYQWTEYGELTPGGSDHGERFNLSYVDQFNDGKVGVAFGFAHTSTPFAGKQFQAWGYPGDPGAFVLGGMKPYVRASTLDRDGLLGVLEFKPNDNVHWMIDVFHSKFEETQRLRGMEVPLFWSGAQLQPGFTVEDGLVTQSTFTNVMPVVRNDILTREDDLFAIGVNLKVANIGAWSAEFDGGFSKVDRDDLNLETWSGISLRGVPFTTADTMTVELRPGTTPIFTSTVDYTDPSRLRLTDSQGWGSDALPGDGMYGYLKGFSAVDALAQLKASVGRELDRVFSHIEFGLSYTDRSKNDGEDPSGFIHSPTEGVNTLPMPPSVGITDFGFLGLGSIYAYDPRAAFDSGVYGFTPNLDTGIVANRYNIDEELTRGFIQATFDGKWGTVPVKGNLGVQVIHASQNGEGFSAAGTQLNPVSDGTSYTDVTPSLNVNFGVAEDTYIRVGVSRQLARPRMHDMRASRTWGYNAQFAGSNDLAQSPWSGSGGNIHLRPWKADAADISFEHYFKDNKGYIAVAGFYKKLKTYIYQQNSLADFTGYPVLAGPEPVLRQGIVSQPVNGEGGAIKGVEITARIPSELIFDSFKGLGVMGSFAYTDSSISPWGPGNGDAPISGLARRVANMTVYYERGGFSARISQRYRSETREYITNFGVPNLSGDISPNGDFTIAEPEAIVDAQISYSFGEGTFDGLTLYLQGYNLTDEPLITLESGDPRRVRNYQTYGASYSIGASYKF
jgi:iron complex outermembrane receptor protein